MNATRIVAFMLFSIATSATHAQLVVRERQGPPLPNPASAVRYPDDGGHCKNTLADAGARAVLRAMDDCPNTFFESRQAYFSYTKQAILGLAVPGATEAVGALFAEKAAENLFFCLSASLIAESPASEADKRFLNALLEEAKEVADRADFARKLKDLHRGVIEKGAAPYLSEGEANTFVQTLDATLTEREEGLEKDPELIAAGLARYDTPEVRAERATEAARALVRECRFEEADTALTQAQQRNLEFLAQLRGEVSEARRFRRCVESDGLRQRGTALDPVSPFLRHSINGADADLRAAQARDDEQTAFIGQIDDLHRSVRLRRNDIQALQQRAAQLLDTARQAAGECDWARAQNALDTVGTETLECAVRLDDSRRARDTLAQQVRQAQEQLGALEGEYQKIIALPFAEVHSCGDYSIVADTFDQMQGQCRELVNIESKVAALRNRARLCADFKAPAAPARENAPLAPGALVGNVTLSPPRFDDHGNGGTTSANFEPTKSTWERFDRVNNLHAKIEWTYNGVPETLSPNQAVTITVTGGVVQESPKGASDGLVLSGVVAIYGDVAIKTYQQADRGNPVGRYEFVVGPQPASVEIHLGGAPAGTGAIWRYVKPQASTPGG